MRWADVYVCMLADGVALRNRCPQGQADPRAAIAGGASGVTMARAGPHPRRARSMRWADVYVPHVSPASMSPASMAVSNRAAPLTSTTRDLPKRLLAERVVHSEWPVQCLPLRLLHCAPPRWPPREDFPRPRV